MPSPDDAYSKEAPSDGAAMWATGKTCGVIQDEKKVEHIEFQEFGTKEVEYIKL